EREIRRIRENNDREVSNLRDENRRTMERIIRSSSSYIDNALSSFYGLSAVRGTNFSDKTTTEKIEYLKSEFERVVREKEQAEERKNELEARIEDREVEYSSLERVLESKKKEQVNKTRQYQLLKNYLGCKQCGSLEVDAYNLYEKNKLNYGCLPVNAGCAREWLKNKEHLSNCACLEQEAKEIYELFASSLREMVEKLKKCSCEESNKPRTPYYDSANYGYAYWLEVKEKVLCLKCLGELVEKMPAINEQPLHLIFALLDISNLLPHPGELNHHSSFSHPVRNSSKIPHK
ncbi:16573_t:CDS:2, partial [Funneliformis geosporum]